MSTKKDLFNMSEFSPLIRANGIYDRTDEQWYTKFKRFGCIDPFNSLSTVKEYLFFTKPDLNLVVPGTNNLNPDLQNQSYFLELHKRYPDIIYQLQRSSGFGKKYPFMNVLSNSVKNTLDLPEIVTTEVDTPATLFGTSIDYRGSGFSSDEKVEFTLEFEDTKYLELYQLFKAYENYERLKKIGMVKPPNINNAPEVNGYSYNSYLENKELHDQFGVYKFIVDEDYQTIIYYAYLTGVFIKNVPRDAFSDLKVDGGLVYSVGFKAAFVDDMNPEIIYDFNNLVQLDKVRKYQQVNIYDQSKDRINGDWAGLPWIDTVEATSMRNTWNGPNNMQYIYKLKWGLMP